MNPFAQLSALALSVPSSGAYKSAPQMKAIMQMVSRLSQPRD